MSMALVTFLLMMEGRAESGIFTFISEEYAFTGPEHMDSGRRCD